MLKSLKFIIVIVFLFMDRSLAITFDEILKHALKNSPDIKISSLDINLASNDLDYAYSYFYPTLSLALNSEYSKRFDDGYNSVYVGESSLAGSTTFQNSASLILRYDILKFGADYYRKESAKQKIETMSFKKCDDELNLALEILENYKKVLILKNSLNINSQKIDIYETILDYTKRLNKIGEKSKLDVADININLSQIKDEILSAKTQTAYALNMISMLSNLDINDAFDFNDFNIQKNYEFLDFKDTFMATQIVSKIKEDELNIKSLESSFYPTISFYAKYDFYGDDKDRYWKSVQDSKKYGYRVGISFTWDIFDGGRKNAQLNRARLENEQNKLKLKAANLKYDKEIMDMRNFKNNEEETLKNLELLSKESKRLKDMSLSLNKNGQSDKITVLNQTINALNKEQSLKENIINAGYNLTKADLIAKQKRWCE